MGNQFNFNEDFEEWCINNKRTEPKMNILNVLEEYILVKKRLFFL